MTVESRHKVKWEREGAGSGKDSIIDLNWKKKTAYYFPLFRAALQQNLLKHYFPV